jgi:Pentapeptide repeats (8 copies)
MSLERQKQIFETIGKEQVQSPQTQPPQPEIPVSSEKPISTDLLSLLKTDNIGEFNRIRSANSGLDLNLVGAHLRGANLSGANLVEAINLAISEKDAVKRGAIV